MSNRCAAHKDDKQKKQRLKRCFFLLIIFRVYLEIALRVRANGADGGGFRADYYMSAVAAFPNLNLAFFKHGGGLNVL